MVNFREPHAYDDFVISSLRSQISTLVSVLDHIERGNDINEYVNENIRRVERDLNWLRRSALPLR